MEVRANRTLRESSKISSLFSLPSPSRPVGGSDAVAAGEGQDRPSPRLRLDSLGGRVTWRSYF